MTREYRCPFCGSTDVVVSEPFPARKIAHRGVYVTNGFALCKRCKASSYTPIHDAGYSNIEDAREVAAADAVALRQIWSGKRC